MAEANAIEEKSKSEQPCFIPDDWVFDGNMPTRICRSKASELPAATADVMVRGLLIDKKS